MLGRTDPLQEALSAKRTHSFYSVPATHSDFFKTQKYDFEHFGLSFTQRVMAFVLCFGSGMMLLFYSFMRLPAAFIYPISFATPFALSNLMFFLMPGFLSGFKSYFNNLFSRSKRVYTTFFIVSTLLTLYSAVFGVWGLFKFLLMFIQIIAVICFSVSFLPGGATGITSLLGIIFKR